MRVATLLVLSSLAYSQISLGPAKRVSNGSTLPATCNPGDIFFKTTAPIALFHCFSANVWSNGWFKYNVATKASCVSTNPCWTVNSVEGADLAAGLTQDVVLFFLPINGFIEDARLKTLVAFTGTTSLTASLGTSTNNVFYLASSYDLKAAVGDTNFAPTSGSLASRGSTTAAGVNVVLGITSTVENINALAAGKSVDVWIKRSVLP